MPISNFSLGAYLERPSLSGWSGEVGPGEVAASSEISGTAGASGGRSLLYFGSRIAFGVAGNPMGTPELLFDEPESELLGYSGELLFVPVLLFA